MKDKKKPLIVEIKNDAGKKARREARAVVGAPKPSRPLADRTTPKKPKYKKPITAGDEE